MTREEAQRLVAEHGSIRAAARASGVSRHVITRLVRGESATPREKPRARTLDEFRRQYDKSFIVPQRIRDALRKLGPNGWDYEVDFARLAGVSLADLGRFRDAFAAHIVTIGRDSRRAWAGSPRLANAMREMLA